MATPATRSHPPSSEQEAKPVLVEGPGARSARQLDGKDLTIAIVFSRWYGKDVVDPLVTACVNELLEKGVRSSNVIRVEVSGAFEIPFAASQLIQSKREALDAVVCIGCMVKGATMAFEFVSEAVTMAIMKLNVMTDTPVVFGVLTCASAAQAKQCAASAGNCCGSETQCSHGVEWAQSALELAHLKRHTAAQTARKCACKCHCASSCNCSCHCTKCQCAKCTCDECACTSCTGGGSSKAPTKPPHGACASCNKPSESCDCVGCNCRTCSSKARSKESS